MYYLFAFLFFILWPLTLASICGSVRAFRAIIIFVYSFLMISCTFLFGCLLMSIFSSTHWKHYKLPNGVLWSEIYMNSLSWQDPMIHYLAYPYIFFADLIRIYLQVTVFYGNPLLWVVEIWGYYLLYLFFNPRL